MGSKLRSSCASALAAVFLCLFGFAGSAVAQEQTGSIQGVVKDPSGSVLPGATVEARSPAAVGVTTAISDGSGVYRFPALPPGTYDVSAALQGFAPASVNNVAVELGKNLVVDLTLRIAGVAEEVTVTSESSPIIDI